MKRFILRFIATIICAIIIILFGVCAVFGILWIIDFFNIPAYIFVPIIAILFLWCIYKEFFGGDKMTETRQTVFRQTKEEFEELKRDAHAHNMNVSEYIRYLVAKERKERENGKAIM